MDLEIVGRHALLFDDDAMAAFVNSGAALVDWHSLQIDRYDVRHLLSSPPPPRRRNRNFKPALLENSSVASLLDHERFQDLSLHPEPLEEHEDRTDAPGYRTVAFSYGYTDNSTETMNADAGMESSRFLPPFPIPNDLLQSLPPSEKVHKIITRTALFVSKNGAQSEIILRVKQGDNPTFGFLMPGHHLHEYFRFLVEHPELHSESDGKFQDEQKKSAIGHNQSDCSDGALTLLGYVYGSGEEEEAEDNLQPEKDVSHDRNYSLHQTDSHTLKKTESQADAKDELVSKKPIFSNRETILTGKNSLITGSKSGTAKGKEEKPSLLPDAADKTKSLTMGMASNIGPVTLEPPPDLRRLIDELVKVIMRKGKQFEATLIEQDTKHEQFPFLIQSNPYHSYYLKVLQTAQKSEVSDKGFNCGSKELLGYRVDKNASALEEMDFSSMATDVSLESDWKKKFKMVIGKSKKEILEAGSKVVRPECGVDAASAAALLQAATRGINDSNLVTSSSVHVSVNNSEGLQPGNSIFDSPLSSKLNTAVEKSDQNRAYDVSAAAPDTADSMSHLTKEQKLKAERLRRAKKFVAMLKIGELPSTAGTSYGSSLEPLEPGVSRSAAEVNLDCKKGEASLTPADLDGPATGEQPERNYFGEHNLQLSKRNYRLRSGVCEVEDKKHSRRHSTRNHKSISQRNDECIGNETTIEMERRHHSRRYGTHSSDDREDEGKSSEEDWDLKHYKVKHRSHDHQHVDECEYKYKQHKSHKRSRKKYCKKSHKTHSSSDASVDAGESSEEGRDHKHYKVKYRSHDHQHVEKCEDECSRKKYCSKSHKTHSSSDASVDAGESSEEGRDHKHYKVKYRSHDHEHVEKCEDEYKEDKNHKLSRKKHGLQSRKRRLSDRYSLDDHENNDYERGEKQRRRRYRSRDKHGYCRGDKEPQCKLKRDITTDDEHHNRNCLGKQNNEERIELEEGEISSRVSEESGGTASGDISLGTCTDRLSFGKRAPSQPSQTTAEVPDDLRAKIRAMLMSTGV